MRQIKVTVKLPFLRQRSGQKVGIVIDLVAGTRRLIGLQAGLQLEIELVGKNNKKNINIHAKKVPQSIKNKNGAIFRYRQSACTMLN